MPARRGGKTVAMSPRRNDLGQPIGDPLPTWEPRPFPPRTPLVGRLCRLERLDAEAHAAALHAQYAADRDGRNWTYLPYGPFASAEEYGAFARWAAARDDTLFYAIIDRASDQPVGVASYLRIDPEMGSIEVGHLSYAPALQRTPLSTEAMYLMMRRVFDELGYRRCEWKCDSLNAASIAAAKRLGFRFEGTFRQAVVVKGRNRDTTWLSILDSEWPAIKSALERWLDPGNFDADGQQRRSLREIMAEAGAEA